MTDIKIVPEKMCELDAVKNKKIEGAVNNSSAKIFFTQILIIPEELENARRLSPIFFLSTFHR